MSNAPGLHLTGRLSGKFAASLLLLMAFAIAVPLDASAQGRESIPDNAHRKSYGHGWECNDGFRETSGACVAVQVPANARPG